MVRKSDNRPAPTPAGDTSRFVVRRPTAANILLNAMGTRMSNRNRAGFRAKAGGSFVLIALLFTRATMADEPKLVRLGKEKEPTVALWLETSLKRVFPNTDPGLPQIKLLAARNGKISFQACLR